MLESLSTFDFGIALGTLVAGIIIGGFKAFMFFMSRRKHRQQHGGTEYFQKISQYDLRLHDLLTELRISTSTARAMIYQFHNGDQFFSGSPIQRVSCTHESVAGGVGHTVGSHPGTAVSLYAQTIDAVLQDSPRIHYVNDIAEGHCKSHLQNLNVVAFSCLPIRQGPHRIIGYVKIHWMYEPITMDEETARLMRDIAYRIESILTHRMSLVGHSKAR